LAQVKQTLCLFLHVERNLMCLCKVDCISLLVKRSFQDKILKIGYVCGILDLTYTSDFWYGFNTIKIESSNLSL
jgi:hypothetical protein